MSMVKIASWTLQGLVNGESVSISGRGSVDPETGGLSLDLEFAAPLPQGFEPVPAQMICNVAATGFAAARSPEGFSWPEFAPEGLQVTPKRIGRVHTPDGVEMLHLSAVTTLSVRPDGLHVDNLVEGSASLPRASTIVSASETLLPGAAGSAVGIAQFELDAGGERLTGVTTSPYRYGADRVLPSVLTRRLTFSDCSWTEHRAHVGVRSSWESLVATGALHE
ncbi:hypothetical protein ACWGI0_05880 [Streptomyces sp. NPDC054802]